MLDQLLVTLQANAIAVAGGAILALIALIVVARRVRKLRAGNVADKLTGPVMFAGMIWSADAVWILTGPDYLDLPTPLRIAMFAVLEFMLLVAMLRAKDSMDRIGAPGRHGGTAWLIASMIAVFGFILGCFEGGLVVAAFRPIIPLMLTKIWWDGLLGDGPRRTGSLKWTPRNLLIALGAIEADDRDVQTVNRDRLIQQMVNLHRRWASATDDSRKSRLETKLTRLSEKADPEIIAAVRHKRALSNWFTVTQVHTRPMPDDVAQLVTQPDATAGALRDAGVASAPARRTKDLTRPLTSGDASDADPATQAARLVLAQGMSTRMAALQVGGTSASSVRRRANELRDAASDAPSDADLTQSGTNGYPVLAGPAN